MKVTNRSKDKIKYNVTMTARCPKCGEDVIVGTAGPAGVSQHTGKSKCKKNVERKKKQEKEGKMGTLYNQKECKSARGVCWAGSEKLALRE